MTTAQMQSPSRMAWNRFRRHRLALVSSGLVVVWLGVAIFAPVIAPYSPYWIDTTAMRAAPTAKHLLGTDLVGRDVLSRLIFGARTSLLVGLGAVSLYVLIGTIMGSVAGYFGGTLDTVITRLSDVILCFPLILVILTIVSLTGASLKNVILVLGLLQWPQVMRYVRAEFLSLRDRDFVIAALAIGAHPGSVIFKHILPNALSPIIIVATFGVATSIILEAALSFLGWGVPLPTASWGNMLIDAQKISILESMPWLWLPPGAAIAVVVLAVNFLGDGLRDSLDPHMMVR